MRKLKVFISVGMRGRTDENIMADICRAKAVIMRGFTEDQIEIIHTFTTEPSEDKRRLACLGESIKIIGECDCCYFVDGWIGYRGCHVERSVCDHYNIPVISGDWVVDTLCDLYTRKTL